jgi:DNA modification methylase
MTSSLPTARVGGGSGVRVIEGDCIASMRALPAETFQTCVTSPPYYGLRDYGHAGQIGLEPSPEEYIARMVEVFREVRRVLRDDGTLWLNLGDSYAATGKSGGGAQGARWQECGADMVGPRGGKWSPAPAGTKPKDLLMIPAQVALALRADGWFLRSDIIWHKPNPMPESITDRPTSAHEHVFLLTKQARYFYDAEAIAEAAVYPGDDRHARTDTRKQSDPMCADKFSRARTGNPTGLTRNARNVWTIATQPYSGAHFATMPPDLAERCIKAGSKPGDHVLDPFGGAGTTGLVADRLGRSATLCELNPEYAALARERIVADAPLLAGVA